MYLCNRYEDLPHLSITLGYGDKRTEKTARRHTDILKHH